MRKVVSKVLGGILVVCLAPEAILAQESNWPQFRGPGGSGLAAGKAPPTRWDVQSGENVLWTQSIPGLAHSSPVVWGERVFVTTSIAEDAERVDFGTGNSDTVGSGSTDDLVVHEWRLIAFDKTTGRELWQTPMHRGVPRVKRHVKASHASATPATDGEHLVVLIGSEGLFCFDLDGNLRWQADVGLLDVGYWGERQYQWGPASSPVIFEDSVIIQNDRHESSALVAYDIATGEERWRAERDEKPAWSTPALYRGETRTVVVTNGANWMRANDASTGEELWRVSHEDLQVITPSPIITGDRAIVTGGNPTGAQPIYALNLQNLDQDVSPEQRVVWKADRGSPYTPTPLAYEGILYVIVDNGILSAYELDTGSRIYRTRLEVGAGFSASPIAIDDKLYLSSEDGDVFVIRAGREYECLREIDMGESLMATPALSDGILLLRGRHTLFAIAES